MNRILIASIVAVGVAAQHASAAPVTYTATLSGAAEVPPDGSPATGTAAVTLDLSANTLQVMASFTGLEGTTIASHIHCCTVVPGVGNAGVATTTPSFAGFPLGVTSGTFDATLDLTLATSWNPAFVTANGSIAGAEAVLAAGLAGGEAYYNIHTTSFPSGEIRGYLVPVPVPEPASMAVLLAGIIGIAAARRRTAV